MQNAPDAFVLDHSIVKAWCFEDESNALADSILESLQRSKAIVPAIWSLEVGNVMLVAERRGRLSEADSTRFLSMLSSLPIYSVPETRQRAMSNIFFWQERSSFQLMMHHILIWRCGRVFRLRPWISV